MKKDTGTCNIKFMYLKFGKLQIVQLFLNHIVQSYFYIIRFSFEE